MGEQGPATDPWLAAPQLSAPQHGASLPLQPLWAMADREAGVVGVWCLVVRNGDWDSCGEEWRLGLAA